MDVNRLAVLGVSADFFLEVGKHGIGACEVAENPIPEDAEVFNVISGLGQNIIGLVLSSPSFDLIDPRTPQVMLPRLPHVVFRKVLKDEESPKEGETLAEYVVRNADKYPVAAELARMMINKGKG